MWIAKNLMIAVTLGLALMIAVAGPVNAELVADGDFESCASGKQLRTDNKGQDWYESRRNTPEGRMLLKLSTKEIAGNATHKAMIKAHPNFNTYLTQRLAEPQKDDFTLRFDILVRKILGDDNRSAFCMIGNDKDDKRGANSTGRERFVFLGFENAAEEGKINLFAREADTGWDEKTIVAVDLDLETWYTVILKLYVKQQEYEVKVNGETDFVALEALRARGKSPKKLTHVSFASWDDGAGTFYVDNVQAD